MSQNLSNNEILLVGGVGIEWQLTTLGYDLFFEWQFIKYRWRALVLNKWYYEIDKHGAAKIPLMYKCVLYFYPSAGFKPGSEKACWL